MIPYQEYEKAVYDWLLNKRELDPNFTFSTRIKGSKGSELDYFIGTEKSGYFGFTLWNIPVSFPGSAGDVIDIFCGYTQHGISYYIQFVQTESPKDLQNELVLKFLKSLKPRIDELGSYKYESKPGNSMFKYELQSPKENYTSIDDLLADLNDTINQLTPIIDEEISRFKATHPEFQAHRITNDEFDKYFIENVNRRQEKYENIGFYEDIEIDFKHFLEKFEKQDLDLYLDFLREIGQYFGLETGDERLVFNVHSRRGHLSFTIGQRYCLTLRKKQSDGDFGFISTKALSNESEQFKGSNPRPWFTYQHGVYISKEMKESIFDAIKFELERSEKSGYRKFNKPEFEELILGKQIGLSQNGNQKSMNNTPLNQILYGPPGTGKTYSTIDLVVDILEPNNTLKREEKKKIYDQLITDNRAYFTTFHQSMSYEEFIEGIKPHTVNDQIKYEVTNGILKDLVEQCFEDIKALKALSGSGTSEMSFKEKFHEFGKAIQIGKIILKTRSGISVKLSQTSNAGNLQLNSGEDTRDYVISMKRLEKLVAAFPKPGVIKNIHEEIRSVIGGSNSSLYFAALEAFIAFDKKLTETVQIDGKEISLSEIELTPEEMSSLPPYFLVIDEINRGNVSAIFGELITLIEEDKRFGSKNQLLITLPYSREEFILPPNLYIIGTMNTADRSVEALDTALRRRFSFVEMLPDPSKLQGKIIDGVDLKLLLETMNERIEVLVDRDHTIGHAFLIDIKSIDELRNAFANKIIPLLQEYFYGNYRKMEMVIGSSFFNITEANKVKFAVQSEDYDADGKMYQILNISDKAVMSDETFIQALQKLMSPE
jgi:5-methylcytosine-specific restriction protein B